MAVAWIAAAALASPTRAERLPLERVSVAEGLAGDHVVDVLRDRFGFVWIATTTGLSRFDGRTLRTYDTGTGLPSDLASALLETSSGDLWVGSRGGLARLHRGLSPGLPPFRTLPLRASDEEPRTVYALAEAADGGLWIGADDGLWYLAGVDAVPRRTELPGPPAPVEALAVGPRGRLWIGRLSGLLRRDPDGRMETFHVAPTPTDDRVTALRVDRSGRVWVGHGRGLFVLGPGGAPASHASWEQAARRGGPLPAPGELVRYGPEEGLRIEGRVNAVRQTISGEIWAVTAAGLARLAADGFRTWGEPEGLPDGNVTTMVEDADGSVWLGTETRGLLRLAPQDLVLWDEGDGLEGPRVAMIAHDAAGPLIATSSRRDGRLRLRLHVAAGRRFVDVTPPAIAGLDDGGWGWGQTVTRSRDGTWWVATGEGLFRFPDVPAERLGTAEPLVRYRVADGLGGDLVFRLFEDRRGDVWIATLAPRVLSRWDHRSGRIDPVDLAADPGGTPTAFAEDGDGRLWLGFYTGGLARWNGRSWRRWSSLPGLPPGFVQGIARDAAGRLWVAAGGRLARMDDPGAAEPRLVAIDVAADLAGVTALALGTDGAVGLGTQKGFVRFDPESGEEIRVETVDGLPASQVSVVAAAPGGAFWIGTLQGLARWAPATRRPPPVPVPRLLEVRVAGRPEPLPEQGVARLESLVVPAAAPRLDVAWAAPLPDRAARLRYQVRIGSGPWSAPDPGRELSLAGLSPGRYEVAIRAVAPDGRRSAGSGRLGFRVLAPPWRRPEVVAPLVLLALAASWWAYRRRILRLLAIERERTRIAADLHDDLGSSLSRVAFLAEMGSLQAESDPARLGALLTDIGATARELTEGLSDIVWAIDPRRDDLASLVARLRRYASDVLETRAIALHFHAPLTVATAIRAETRREVYLILKEAVHNVARHSGAREATVRIELGQARLRATVEDDGRGIARPADAAPRAEGGGHGLPGMRARAERLGGSLAITAGTDGGTRIVLDVPI